jgi:hypothetical protein
MSKSLPAAVRLPSVFPSFLDDVKEEMWSQMFNNAHLFDAQRINPDNYVYTLHIGSFFASEKTDLDF